MYESKFGLTANPFSLNPDPAFYFGSRGHAHALSYLKFGAFQGEGFIVVTGEIGAGKTTLVRTLLDGLDSAKVVAAQIVSTQLEAGDLLRAVATAFGLAPKGLSKAELIATIEAFLTLLVTQSRRALLVVDEAQNLDRTAVEELRMLSNFQLGSHALLQSFLVGQPELRTLLATKSMEQFRQRVIASCHLGPMNADETGAYVQHRLRHAGWDERPLFSGDALGRVFHWSGGIPRRINLICNRVLLAAYLNDEAQVDAPMVDLVAKELRSEVGESADMPVSDATQVAAALAPQVAAPSADRSFRASAGSASMDRRRPVLCIAGSRTEAVKLAVLLRAMRAEKRLPPAYMARIGDGQAELDDDFFQACGIADSTVTVGVSEVSAASRLVAVIDRVLPVVLREKPIAIVVAGDSDAAVAASLLASRSNCRLVCLEGDWLGDGHSKPEYVQGSVVARLAQDVYTSDVSSRELLRGSGIPEGNLHFVGNTMADVLDSAMQHRAAPAGTLAKLRSETEALIGRKGFGLVGVSLDSHLAEEGPLSALLTFLQGVSRDVPLIWPAPPGTAEAIERYGLGGILRGSWLSIIEPLPFLEHVGLLSEARFVISDTLAGIEQAVLCTTSTLYVAADSAASPRVPPTVRLQLEPSGNVVERARWLPILEGTVAPQQRKLWDGKAAARIADHLATVLSAAESPAQSPLQVIAG